MVISKSPCRKVVGVVLTCHKKYHLLYYFLEVSESTILSNTSLPPFVSLIFFEKKMDDILAILFSFSMHKGSHSISELTASQHIIPVGLKS